MELLVIVISLSLTGAQESRLEGPENTLGAVGSTVTLKCSSPSRNCIGIDWQKYVIDYLYNAITIFKGPKTILNTNVTDRDRYSVDNSSGCDLIIRNVQLKDVGRFICSAIISSSHTTKSAYLIVLETQPKCTLNASLHDVVDGEGVQLKCEVTYNGTNSASMKWKGVKNAPAAVKNGNTTISRSYTVVASAPEVPSFICEASFEYETVNYYGRPIEGLATNRILVASCGTPVITIFHSVRNVTLSPSLFNYPPGTMVTCAANGYPPPTFKWQEMENERTWTDIQNQISSKFTMTEVSIKRYRCVAMNVVRGKSYDATSHEILVNNTDRFGIGFGVGLLVAILLTTVVIVILVKVRCLEVHPMPAKRCHDGDAEHMDQEMNPSSESSCQRSPKTEAPLVEEQESAYASLGEDRDANEYASLEESQKSKTKKTSEP